MADHRHLYKDEIYEIICDNCFRLNSDERKILTNMLDWMPVSTMIELKKAIGEVVREVKKRRI
jgi:hypothetical protein